MFISIFIFLFDIIYCVDDIEFFLDDLTFSDDFLYRVSGTITFNQETCHLYEGKEIKCLFSDSSHFTRDDFSFSDFSSVIDCRGSYVEYTTAIDRQYLGCAYIDRENNYFKYVYVEAFDVMQIGTILAIVFGSFFGVAILMCVGVIICVKCHKRAPVAAVKQIPLVENPQQQPNNQVNPIMNIPVQQYQYDQPPQYQYDQAPQYQYDQPQPQYLYNQPPPQYQYDQPPQYQYDPAQPPIQYDQAQPIQYGPAKELSPIPQQPYYPQ